MNNIPTNLDEAIQILDNELIDEDKKYLIENGAVSVHFSLGRWIRNNWNLWDENESLIRQNISEKYKLFHPDDISNFIIEKYIEYLKSNYEN